MLWLCNVCYFCGLIAWFGADNFWLLGAWVCLVVLWFLWVVDLLILFVDFVRGC